jgi:hypothetical protein
MNEPLFPTGRMNRRLLALLRAVEALPPGQQMIITRDNGGVRWTGVTPAQAGVQHHALDSRLAVPPPRPVEPDA